MVERAAAETKAASFISWLVLVGKEEARAYPTSSAKLLVFVGNGRLDHVLGVVGEGGHLGGHGRQRVKSGFQRRQQCLELRVLDL